MRETTDFQQVGIHRHLSSIHLDDNWNRHGISLVGSIKTMSFPTTTDTAVEMEKGGLAFLLTGGLWFAKINCLTEPNERTNAPEERAVNKAGASFCAGNKKQFR